MALEQRWVERVKTGWLGLATTAIAACLASSVGTAACGPDSESGDALGGTGGTSLAAGGGGAAPQGDGGSDFEPEANPCQGHAGETVCEHNHAIECSGSGDVQSQQDCQSQVCVGGKGCVLCIEGQFTCFGNQLGACNTTVSPIQWDLVATCDVMQLEHCNATTGACEQLQPIGNGPDKPTGTYYQYARFLEGSSAFQGGYDVDSFGDYLYVNHDGEYLDVYHVELLDTDGDTVLEPNQHPDNPDKPGPIEERVLSYVGNFHVPSLGSISHSEVYATADHLYFLNAPANPGYVFEYDFGTGTTNPVVTQPSIEFAQLGFDDVNGTWYASHEYHRAVFSFHQASGEWVAEFAYPDLAGDHMDGIEVVTDPNTGEAYVYVSDMTSDYLGQYRRDRHGTWVQVNLFEYAGTGEYVEGLGFGVLNHFWATSGDALYEVGGGELQKYVEPEQPPN